MSEKIKKLTLDELTDVSGGFCYYPLNEEEQARYHFLTEQCEQDDISAIDFNRNVANLMAFCREMKGKYGPVVDPGNLLG